MSMIEEAREHESDDCVPSVCAEVEQSILDEVVAAADFPLGSVQRYNLGGLPDSTIKLLIRDPLGHPRLMVKLSSPVVPMRMRGYVERASQAKAALGLLGYVVLDPLVAGEIGGVSYAAYPYCAPLNAGWGWRVRRLSVTPRVLGWLRAATAATIQEPAGETVRTAFTQPLERLAGMDHLPREISDAAATAVDRLHKGIWTPRTCFMHGDFWKGNILQSPSSSGRNDFVIIDWADALVEGYGIIDLIRVGSSFGLRARRLGSEVRTHCGLLKCDVEDAKSYMLTALGAIGANPGHLPMQQFARLASLCWTALSRAKT